MILEEKKKKIAFNDKNENYESITEKVKELENLSKLLIFIDSKLPATANEK
jgi:hypothetical protein